MTTTPVGNIFVSAEESRKGLHEFLQRYEEGTMPFGTPQSELKPSNPKDMVGCLKTPFSVLPTPVMAEVALGMFEGALKYGRHNYRAVGVRASIYYDATMRHLTSWWEGEDLDPESQLSHITKAISSLTVLRDSMIRENWEDDRPPATPDLYVELNKRAAALVEQYKDRDPKHYTNLNIGESPSVKQ
uniref:dATP/dGTP diphosphohydrolase N-terminal domain-containing protein n=3 Tax=unclassified bacterial viruses TaxID=12333 RepID=A0AAU6VZN1_9VIRU